MSHSDVDIRYDKIKKLMNDLNNIGYNFNSVILTQDQIPKNTFTPKSIDQNNLIINRSKSIFINPGWEFILEKDLHKEKEKLLKYSTL